MTSPGSTTVTVAIPVHNGERHLAEALDSVSDQTRPPTETLVFDNASTDASRRIAAEHLGHDAVRSAQRNQGAAWNFTRAVRDSSGEYFAWLGADDVLRPRFVEVLAAALDARPATAAALPAISFLSADGEPTGEQRDLLLASDDPAVRLRSFLRRPRWTEVYCLYRRATLLDSPMFRDEFGADVVLTWWFLLRGPLAVVDEALLGYRVAAQKSMEEMSESLSPGSRPEHWRKLRMWRSLWRETSAPGVDAVTRRVARRELLTALAGRDWLTHNVWDAMLVMRYLRHRIAGKRGQA
jgi:glycosyltransferase involved in cell wall biosynthesis